MNLNIINLTPHPVKLVTETGDVLRTFPSDGMVRCAMTEAVIGNANGVPVYGTSFGEVVGLPKEAAGTLYIVSSIVAQAAVRQGRRDVVVPHQLVRDDHGNVIGCRAFARPM